MGTLRASKIMSSSLPEWGARLAVALLAIMFAVIVQPRLEAAEYRLAIGDVLTFDFLDDAELPVTATISNDGEAPFPLIGAVDVVGLTVTEAMQKLKDEYRQREILVDPKLSLNIASFRPIFVLGEVKTPGSFPYYSGLTVEQAIGLAGGMQVITSNPSDRIIARARLRAEIEGADAEIIHEGIYAARLVAQLKSKPKVDLNDVPEVARDYIKDASVAGVIELQEKILTADLAARKSQLQILSDGIVQAEGGVEILNELVVQQKEVVSNNEKDLERISSLRKRELNTESDLSRAKNNALAEKAQLLQTFATLARSRQELSEMKLQLSKLSADREKEVLTLLQEREIAIKKLIAERQSAEEQMLLMAAVEADASKQKKISYAYEIRRIPVAGTPTSIKASTLTEMLPGDVLVVAIAGI